METVKACLMGIVLVPLVIAREPVGFLWSVMREVEPLAVNRAA
jgi:hypothetical protein